MSVDGEYEPSAWDWVREQVERFEATDGHEANTLFDTGYPIIVMTNRGVKSGKVRKTPLMRVEHDGEYAAIGSQGGAPKHPGWTYNLLADPHVELQDGAVKQPMIARLVEGEKRALWWQRAVAAYPPYADYQAATDRVIPVFVLSPLSQAS
ncbi:MAG TPA: nitroreductase family deazaflavin-dependent oxidoreductase [Mycobacteriales bacterium]|jgi:deazaflavin-dependent oxidoreductase (nitroreductase family)|nr:nitroreductase family deazaflavin-dependent oxidoreductase [Mycobacteriales bacterium]